MNLSNDCPRMICFLCGKTFRNRDAFYLHTQKHKPIHNCSRCGQRFDSRYKLEIHINTNHRCQYCDFQCAEEDILEQHRGDCHDHFQAQNIVQSGRKRPKFSPYPFREIEAFKGYLHTFRQRLRRLQQPVNSVENYFILYGSKLTEILKQCLLKHHSIKLQITWLCEFIRKDEADQRKETCLHYDNSTMKVILNEFKTEQVYGELVA
jgi:DNA-directed RNA polymerase subunit RPC12/RpoP